MKKKYKYRKYIMNNNYKKILENLETDIFELSAELIKNICSDLNKKNKANEMINKYLKKEDIINKKIQKKSGVKRPKTSYIYFLEDVRPKIAKKYPDDKLGDISKRIGKLWQSLSNKDKDKYEKLAKKDIERFRKEGGKNNIETDIEQSQTLFELESNVQKDNLFSSESNSSSGYESSNSNNSNNSNKSSLEYVSSDDTFSELDSDDTKFDESSIQISNKNNINKLKKKRSKK